MDRIGVRTVELLEPKFLWHRAELVGNPGLVPAGTGVYAWFARTGSLPKLVVAKHRWREWSLINLGKSRVGKTDGLRRRLIVHCTRSAGHSRPFRLLLGKLLEDSLGLRLLYQGHPELFAVDHPGRRKPWPEGECRLDAWLDECAAVTWILTEDETEIEGRLIWALSPPCNSEDNPWWEELISERRALGVSRRALRWGTWAVAQRALGRA